MESHTILSIVACLNTWLVSAGVIYGWTPLHDLLVKENQFPDDQESSLQTIFNTAFISLSIATFIYGFMLDRVGPRITVMTGITVFIGGNILMAFSDYKSFNAFLPGFSMIAAGGIAPFMCHFNFANVFENYGSKKAYFISIINALFNISGFNYMLIPILNFSRKQFFLCYVAVGIFSWIMCFLTYPDRIVLHGDKIVLPVSRWFGISKDDSEDEADGEKPQAALLPNPSDEETEQEAKRAWDHEKKLLTESIFSKYFMMLVYWYSMNLLTISFTTASVPDILSKYHHRPRVDGKDLYSSFLTPILSNVAFIFAPFSGYLIAQNGAGFPVTFLLVNISTCLVLAVSIFPVSWGISFQIVTLLSQAMQKGFMFNLFYSYLAIEYPMQINGSLISFVTFCSSIAGTLNYLLIFLTQKQFNDSYVFGNIALLVLMIPAFFMSRVSKLQSKRKDKDFVEYDDLPEHNSTEPIQNESTLV